MQLFNRKRLFVERRIQRALLARIVFYWFFGLLAVSELLLCWDILIGPDGSFFELVRPNILWTEHSSVVMVSLLVLVLVLVDIVRVTNRMAGPLVRIRRSLRAVAAGEHVEPMTFRDKDYWQGMAQDFNDMLAYVDQLKRKAGVADAPPTHDELDDALDDELLEVAAG